MGQEVRTVDTIGFIAGIVVLVTAGVLLIDVAALRRVAEGAAIAEYVAYVMAGVIALTASVLVGWVGRFLPMGLSASQARLAADLLVLVAMVLLGVYFFRVRRVMVRYLKAYSGEELLARAQGPAEEGATETEGSAADGTGDDGAVA